MPPLYASLVSCDQDIVVRVDSEGGTLENYLNNYRSAEKGSTPDGRVLGIIEFVEEMSPEDIIRSFAGKFHGNDGFVKPVLDDDHSWFMAPYPPSFEPTISVAFVNFFGTR